MFNRHGFHCHVAKVLPLVYDDSLSYYEVLCKLTHKINEIINLFDNEVLKQEVHEYVQSPDFSAWLRDYIESEEFSTNFVKAFDERNAGFSKLAVFGDSNADGFGWQQSEGVPKSKQNDGWTVFLREKYPALKIENFASAGATFVEDNANTIYAQYSQMINSGFIPDVIAIQAGANDVNRGSDTIGFSGDFYNTINTDRTTSCGAFNYLVRDINQRFPDCKVYFFVRPYMPTQNKYLYSFGFDRLMESAIKLNIPIFDMTGSLASYFNGNGATKYIYQDGVHWNRYGYQVVSRFVAEFLKNPVSNGVVKNDCWCIYTEADDLYKLKGYLETYLPNIPKNINFHGTCRFLNNFVYKADIVSNETTVRTFDLVGSYSGNVEPRKIHAQYKSDNGYRFSVANMPSVPSAAMKKDFPSLEATHMLNFPYGTYYLPDYVFPGGFPNELQGTGKGYFTMEVYGREDHADGRVDFHKNFIVHTASGQTYYASYNNQDAFSGWRKVTTVEA